MKRFLVTILSILYMASATGATVHVHYCMGKLVGASLVHHEDHRCNSCGMKKTPKGNGCCKDEHKTIKSSDQHLLVKAIVDISSQQAALLPLAYRLDQVVYNKLVAYTSVHINAPPLIQRTPIFLQIRSLRI